MILRLNLCKTTLSIHWLKTYVVYIFAISTLLGMVSCNAYPPSTMESSISQDEQHSSNMPKDSNVALSKEQQDKTKTNPTVSNKCDNVKEVGKKVKELVLACEAIQLIKVAEQVQSFTVEPYPALPDDESITEDKKIGRYPIEAESRKLTAQEKTMLQDLIFSDNHYVFSDAQKRCLFQPKIAFRFSKGSEKLAILISFGCKMWRFVYKNNEKTFDFTHATSKELVKLRDAVFPIPETQVEPAIDPEKAQSGSQNTPNTHDSEKVQNDLQNKSSTQTEVDDTESSKPEITGSTVKN